MTAELLFDAKDIVGESIIWVPSELALYWVDIVGARIHRLHPESGDHTVWPTPELPTSIGLRQDGGFIVGLRQRVTLWRPGGAFETLAVPEPDKPGNRLNEGAVAPDGSFWVGTMQENIGSDGEPKAMTTNTGALYRIAPDGAVAQLTAPDFGITNTMVWTDDGRFITADTTRNELYQYDYDATSSKIANRRQFAAPIPAGLPDGSTQDRLGTIYNARVASGKSIARLSRLGELLELIPLPCSAPTSCVFGGPDLTMLYVTSAQFGMTLDQLAANPFEGALVGLQMAHPGFGPRLFG